MTHLSLFSGIGGIDLAAEWAGFESVAMVERDKYCQKVLAKNFPNAKIYDDVTTFNGYEYKNKIDLISGGFPCQPHSLAGKRKASGDERDLWSEVVRIIRESQPKFFLGENVRGLLSSESGAFFGRILNDLDELGYRVGWCLYGAKDIGAVHRRERVFIVAHASGIGGTTESDNRERGSFCGERKQCDSNRCEGGRMDGRDNADSIGQTDAADTDSVRLQQYTNKKEKQSTRRRATRSVTEGHDSSIHRDVADSESIRRNNGSDYWREGCICSGFYGVIHENSEIGRDGRSESTCDINSKYENIWTGDWRNWDVEPVIYETEIESRIRRTDDGFSSRVDRLKALGNAVVPQQVYPILAEIAAHIRGEK
jgi:DNA (cytosine-5)-methyltransferase 1